MHPLGPLATLAADAHEWRARQTGRAATWAGLWPTALSNAIIAQVLKHTRRPDAAMVQRLARRGAFPGVRNFAPLLAVLPLVSLPPLPEEPSSTPEDELADVIPIWHHGVFAQASLSDVRHATHLVRVLDDYHEPTLAAMRRQRVRALPITEDAAARQAAGAAATQTFLAAPIRWRDVVERAVHQDALRGLEGQLGQRLKGPRRTPADLEALVTAALELLATANEPAAAEARQVWQARMGSLQAATVVLVYEEHAYLQLAGVQDDRTVRRHLSRGLHLVFSDQDYRRADRTAGLWLNQSEPEQSVDQYHWAAEVPPAYAARKQTALFRLADEEAVVRYGTE